MDRINKIIEQITPVDEKTRKKARQRLDIQTKPRGSLGRLEELAEQVAGIRGTLEPVLDNKVIFTMAGDHGVVEEGVSAFPAEVTAQMVYNFLAGGAGINVLAKHVGAKVKVVDMGVAADLEPNAELIIKKIAPGTKNMTKGPAMTRDEAIKAVCAGIEVFEEVNSQTQIDMAATGDMGIGNTTASSAIIAVFSKDDLESLTGRGTGIDDQTYQQKIAAIKKAIQVNQPNKDDVIDVLAKVGGFEIGGLCGLILAAAARKVPIVIDGFISTAGSLLACKLCPKVSQYLISAHKSVEIGHTCMLEMMGLTPLLDLNMRLGEGTGAALGMSLVEAGVKILKDMATFEDAGVSKGE